jgi:serine/threonine-protein kinase
VAYALAYAHDAGIVHRDVKPENVIVVGKRRVKLTDFGIASLVRVPGGDEEIVGSPKYMSPEQARGADVDGRADLFSLGVVLYEMLTGVQPFAAPGVEDTVRRVRETTPHCPSELNSLVPPEIDALVMRMLAKDPEERVSSARRLYRELRKWLKARGAEVDERDDQLEKLDSTVHRASSARESTLVMRDKGKAKRHVASWRRPALAGALVGVLLASGVGLWSFGVGRLEGERGAEDVALGPSAQRAVAAGGGESAVHTAHPVAATPGATETALPPPVPDLADLSAQPVDSAPSARPAHASGSTATATASRARPARRGHPEAGAIAQPVAAAAPSEAVAELPPPPPPPVPMATVRLAISPWGEVFVDGKFRGMTPPMESVELPPGRHRLEIRNSILPTYIADVRLDAGDTQHIRHRFE